MTNSRFGVCPLFTFEKIISGKWMLPVLRRIEKEEEIRFGALLRCFPDITKATLTKQLKKLEETGFIERREEEGYPRSVSYCISTVGKDFLSVFNPVENWCEEFLADRAQREHRPAEPVEKESTQR